MRSGGGDPHYADLISSKCNWVPALLFTPLYMNFYFSGFWIANLFNLNFCVSSMANEKEKAGKLNSNSKLMANANVIKGSVLHEIAFCLLFIWSIRSTLQHIIFRLARKVKPSSLHRWIWIGEYSSYRLRCQRHMFTLPERWPVTLVKRAYCTPCTNITINSQHGPECLRVGFADFSNK